MEASLSMRDRFTVFFVISMFYLITGSHATVILLSIQDRATGLSLFILAISLIATWLWTKATIFMILKAYANIESHS